MYKLLIMITFLLVSVFGYAGPGDKDNHALIIVDMQPNFVTMNKYHNKKNNRKKLEIAIERQLLMIHKAKKSGIPVIIVEYTNSKPTYSRLRRSVAGYKNSLIVEKSTNSIFTKANKYLSRVTSFLNERQVGSLIIAGANGGACVKSSIKDALRYNYNVATFSDAIIDFTHEEFIYPYKLPIKSKPTCNDCTLKEYNSLAEYTLLISEKNSKESVKGISIDHSNRDEINKDSNINKTDQNKKPISTTTNQ